MVHHLKRAPGKDMNPSTTTGPDDTQPRRCNEVRWVCGEVSGSSEVQSNFETTLRHRPECARSLPIELQYKGTSLEHVQAVAGGLAPESGE